MIFGLRGWVVAVAGVGAVSAVSLAAAVITNVVSSILAPAPAGGGAGASAPIPSIAITSPSPASGAAAGATGTPTPGDPLSGDAAGTSFLVALDSSSPPMGQPLVLFLLPSNGSVTLTGAGCPSTGCLAPTAGLYGYNGAGSVSGPGDVYAQLGLAGGAGYGVTVPGIAGAAGAASYLVQAFEVPVNLDPAAPIALSEVGAPAGTVVMAYDCADLACAGGAAASPLATVGVIMSGSNGSLAPTAAVGLNAANSIGTTPTQVAEPGGLAIVGAMLIALGLLYRANT